MERCKLMKRRKRNYLTLNSLPHDLLTDIVARVASSSLKDAVNAKLSCKGLRKAAEEKQIFRCCSLETIPVDYWTICPQAESFLKRCQENRNPESLYRRGMFEYFSRERIELGIELLKDAADSGHQGAMYALGIILFSDKSSELRGKVFLNKAASMQSTNNTGMAMYRIQVEMILRILWSNNKLRRREYECSDPMCRNGGMKGCARKGEWSIYYEEIFCCEDCKWDWELNLFCDILCGI